MASYAQCMHAHACSMASFLHVSCMSRTHYGKCHTRELCVSVRSQAQSVRHSHSCVQALMQWHVPALTARGVAVHSCTQPCSHAPSTHALTQQCIQSCCGQQSPQHTLRRREPCLSALKPQHRQQEQGSLLPATGSDAYATARPVVCSPSSCDPQLLVGGDVPLTKRS
jgi:hypothetical protein